jgi:hypothetical protein
LLAQKGRPELSAVKDLYNITVAIDQEKNEYGAAVYSCEDGQVVAGRSTDFTVILKMVTKRIRSKEKQRRKFPLVTEPPVDSNKLIVLPNGGVNEALSQ